MTVDIHATGCVKGDVLPLIGGLSSREGFVEVCAGAGYFPLDVASFTIREANVLCRQMELGSGIHEACQQISMLASVPMNSWIPHLCQ